MQTFDIAIIHNCDEVVSVVLGKGVGLFTSLKRETIWERFEEDIFELELEMPNDIEELSQLSKENDFQYQLTVMTNKVYHFR
jgi:hypothetical protein